MPPRKREDASDPPSFERLKEAEDFLRALRAQKPPVPYKELPDRLEQAFRFRYSEGILHKFLQRPQEQDETEPEEAIPQEANATTDRPPDAPVIEAPGQRDIEALRDRMAELHAQMTALRTEKDLLAEQNAALQERMEALEREEAQAMPSHDWTTATTPFVHGPARAELEEGPFDWHAPVSGPYEAVVLPSTGRRLRASLGKRLRKAAPVLAALAVLIAFVRFGQAMFVGVFGQLAALASGGADALLTLLERAEQTVMDGIRRVGASPLIPVGLALLAVVWFFGLRSLLRFLAFVALLIWCLGDGHPGLALLLCLLALLWWYRRG